MDIETIYQRITQLIKEKELTQNKFELESGCGKNFVSRLSPTRPKKPTMPSIEKMALAARYFNVSMDYLCGLTDIKTPADILSGLTDDDIELIKKFNSASAGRREAILELLKSPAPSREAQDGGADLQ